MKRTCPFCGFANPPANAVCSQCNAELPPPSNRERRIPKLFWLLPPLLAAGVVAQAYRTRPQPLYRWVNENTFEVSAGLATNRPPTKVEKASRKNSDDGKTAAERHAEEWKRRLARDPEFAHTLLEATMLELEHIGKDPQLAPEEALQQVAEMVLPAGSRIEVTKAPTSGFRVRAAFPLKPGHTSVAELRRDIDDATARAVKDLFASCGGRGIESISVSCNTLVSSKSAIGDEPEVRYRSLYRAILDGSAAAGVANWRHLPLASVKRLLKIDRDLTPTLILSEPSAARPRRVSEPLEF